MSNGKVAYLVGPITGQSYDGAVDWREDVAAQLEDIGMTCLSPMRGKAYLKDEREIADHYDRDDIAPKLPLSEETGIVGRDFHDVKKCNLLFANLLPADRVSIGSMFEIAWAHLLKYIGAEPKVIIVIMEEKSWHDHGFVRQSADYIVDNLEDAVTLAKMIFDF